MKSKIIEEIDGDYKFEKKKKMVEEELKKIWKKIKLEMKKDGRNFEEEEKKEEDDREEYRKIEERRVSIGIVI